MVLGKLPHPVFSLSDTIPRDFRDTRGTWIRSHSHMKQRYRKARIRAEEERSRGLEEAQHFVDIFRGYGRNGLPT